MTVFNRRTADRRAPESKKLTTPFQVKSIDEAKRSFTGLASTWEEDLGGDVIHKGAFKKTLEEWRAGGKVLPLIDQHNYGSIRSVVGKLIDAKETAEGLEAEFEIIAGVDGDEALCRIKGGYIDSLSIGYRAVKWETEETEESRWGQIRHLNEVALYEVSLVIWPMNEGARIDTDSVKSAIAALTDEEKAEVRALLQEPKADDPPADPAPAAPELMDAAKQSALQQQLLRFNIDRAVTRIGEPTLGDR